MEWRHHAVGLPAHWRLFVDAALLRADAVILGMSCCRSKLLLPGALLAELAGAELVEGWATRRRHQRQRRQPAGRHR